MPELRQSMVKWKKGLKRVIDKQDICIAREGNIISNALDKTTQAWCTTFYNLVITKEENI